MKETQLITLANLLRLAAIIEIATGIALLICPSCVALLLLNSELAGASLALGRVTGLGLLSLGIACWPNQQIVYTNKNPALWAILVYGALITIYLVYLGIEGQWVGWLLWPAAILHAALTILLAWKSGIVNRQI